MEKTFLVYDSCQMYKLCKVLTMKSGTVKWNYEKYHYEMSKLWNVVTMKCSHFETSHYECLLWKKSLWNDDYEKSHYETIHCPFTSHRNDVELLP